MLEGASDCELDVLAGFPGADRDSTHHNRAVKDLRVVGKDQSERSADDRKQEAYLHAGRPAYDVIGRLEELNRTGAEVTE